MKTMLRTRIILFVLLALVPLPAQAVEPSGAEDERRRSVLRASLRERLRASPLFDGARIARRIEAFA